MIKSLKIMYNQSIAEVSLCTKDNNISLKSDYVCFLQAQQRNMQIYAKILFSHGLERTDLVYVGQRYNLEDFGNSYF